MELREQILRDIEKDARVNLHELAIRLGVSEAEVANEIADMEKEHIICGYNTLINWDNTSLEKVTALIEVQAQPQRGLGFDAIAERLYKYSEITSVYLMSGGFDFAVIIEGKSMKSIAQFVAAKLATLDSIRSCATHFVLKKYKDYGVVFDENRRDEREKITP
ncbi:MAG: Lrp/AsnC family transcriptional regulator [Lachnospiraceae bacterium]|jgi:DNA-binding Lrp family transcriptional regulator|nr:Lrp/AsnC family transcriptional regulator [Lachnospiraceae bacterium]MCH4032119.1 Lrp/AsnC family transcriptional regulator [Lachnospiraceae bacterium]MCH4109003.1 Lrp/AsnC family transcriptional regulator [Lachnospiraceae bacterium]MCI1302243.1 Lrp/AsnC family transcriptional regulator [Lachnospiraceae bacterium]MCI1332784.1 Lrp/AsnC family transcriptional regulator [Lachnospiraceae bacterium]